MTSHKYKLHKLKSIFAQTGVRCGCGPSASDVVEPTPKSSSVNVSEDHMTSTTDTSLSPSVPCSCCHIHATTSSPKTVIAAACPKIHDSLAVVQESDDPYRDFRRSMLQMIFENEIYSRDDLQQLLDCFLQLNSPLHHQVIFRAFMEIWDGDVFDSGGGGGGDAVGSGGAGHVKTLNSQVG